MGLQLFGFLGAFGLPHDNRSVFGSGRKVSSLGVECNSATPTFMFFQSGDRLFFVDAPYDHLTVVSTSDQFLSIGREGH